MMCHDVRVELLRSSALLADHGFPFANGVPRALAAVTQVHGAKVVQASAVSDQLGEADGLWTETPGLALGIKTADCVPLLLDDPQGRRVAGVHAGWRGTIAEIPLAGLEALVKRGSKAGEVRAAVGPSIRGCCYAVGADLAERFVKRFGAKVAQARDGQVYLDLAVAVEAQLREAGVSQIDLSTGLCTSCDRRFHSYRREKGAPGRQVSFIVCDWPRGGAATRV